MSVLVFDGISLAADSFANNGTTAFPYEKIWKAHGRLFGVIGPLNEASALRQWADTNLDPCEYPHLLLVNSKAQLIAVSKEKGLLRYKNSANPYLHGLSKLAIGEGADIAYGAMEHGATAEQAVAAAIKYSIHCNGTPEVLHL